MYSKVFRICIEPDCGGEFYITPKDQAYLLGRGLALPRRCYSCRQKNKAEAERQLAAQRLGTEATGTENDPNKWHDVWADNTPKPTKE